jgi:peptidoglycan hydrolase-like protein with peptidoglycan-binding domain
MKYIKITFFTIFLLGFLPSVFAATVYLRSSAPASTVFTRNLKVGSSGSDVKALQVFLNNAGFPVAKSGNGSSGKETTFFGPATAAALVKFQQYYSTEILTPYGLTKGTGFFGAASRALVNQLEK